MNASKESSPGSLDRSDPFHALPDKAVSTEGSDTSGYDTSNSLMASSSIDQHGPHSATESSEQLSNRGPQGTDTDPDSNPPSSSVTPAGGPSTNVDPSVPDLPKSEENRRDDTWKCSRCTFENHHALDFCEVCEMPRSSFVQGRDTAHRPLPPGVSERYSRSVDAINDEICRKLLLGADRHPHSDIYPQRNISTPVWLDSKKDSVIPQRNVSAPVWLDNKTTSRGMFKTKIHLISLF